MYVADLDRGFRQRCIGRPSTGWLAAVPGYCKQRYYLRLVGITSSGLFFLLPTGRQSRVLR